MKKRFSEEQIIRILQESKTRPHSALAGKTPNEYKIESTEQMLRTGTSY